ncbi:MAG: HD-GYP domain-containing protein [Thermotogota bacterium]
MLKMVDFLKKQIILKIFLFVFISFIIMIGFNIYQTIHQERIRVEAITNVFEQSIKTFEENLEYLNNDFNDIIKDFHENNEQYFFQNKEEINNIAPRINTFNIDYYVVNKNNRIIDSSNNSYIDSFFKNDPLLNSLSFSENDLFITDFLLDNESDQLIKYLVSKKNNGNISIIELKISDNIIKQLFSRLSSSVLEDRFDISNSSTFIIDKNKQITNIFREPQLKDKEIINEILSTKDSFIQKQNILQKNIYYIYEMKNSYYQPIRFVIEFNINNILTLISIITSIILFILFFVFFLLFIKSIAKKSEKMFIKPVQEIIDNTNNFDLQNPDNSNLIENISNSRIKEIKTLEYSTLKFQKTIKDYFQQLKTSYSDLEDAYATIEEKNHDMKNAYLNFAQKLSLIAEGHDEITGKHIYRVGEMSALIAEKLGKDEDYVENIKNFAPLHDIGKIFIPVSILKKETKLTDQEWELMKKHTTLSEQLLDDEYFNMAKNIALYHHERNDGTGYPFGLKGEEIPIEAQIVQLADIFDALRSERTYKKSFSLEKTYEIITKGDGRVEKSHFSPEVIKIFEKYHKEIDEIFLSMQD